MEAVAEIGRWVLVAVNRQHSVVVVALDTAAANADNIPVRKVELDRGATRLAGG